MAEHALKRAEGFSPLVGLQTEEVTRLREQYGFNEIEQEKAKSPWALFVEQFKSPLVMILIFACALSGVLGEWAEMFAITAILVLNAFIGFFQEYRAENAVLALKNMTAPRATVIRAGKQLVIPAREIVPDELLLLEAGDIVAADGLIIESSRLQINEAVLTGESLPVEKSPRGATANVSLAERQGAVFMGTAVATGTAKIKVINTGMKTELGKIAHQITTAESLATPLQEQLAQVGKTLLKLCLLVVSIVFGIGIVTQKPLVEVVLFSVSLAVAAVPEGMPAIVTVALALGVQRMTARNALIRRLSSVETLGSVSVICTDKTGTLTTGNMRVRELWGEDHRDLLRSAASCCDAELGSENTGTGDPTEIAILLAARERHISREDIERSNSRVKTEPFDSERKRMSVLRHDGVLYVKGAVESILPLCLDESKRIEEVKAANLDLTSCGLRVLVIATGKGPEEKKLKLQGLIGIADPPRTEVMDAIREARTAGVTPVMITGDHPVTAAAIARELGLVLNGEDISTRVHARATPEDKLKIIRFWKEKNKIVAMTGDGVNDAPALKEAHIGIAMGRAGTEVTRQAADLILADDNFATIVAAIKEGRGIYNNIKKATIFLLTGNLAELWAVLGAIALGLPIPFLAAHLLWINLVTDSLPGLALVADPVSSDVMKKQPRPADERLLGRPEWTRISWVGALEGSVVLTLFFITLQSSGEDQARNLAFTTLVLSQLWRSFSARSLTKLFWEVGPVSNLWLLGVVILTAFLQLSLHFIPLMQNIFKLTPLTMSDLEIMLPLSMIPVSAIELKKLAIR